SVSSPLARGLINKSVDDVVEINSPKGAKSYTIISVKYI
ncbi:MAG: transcription elongation factor GreA, partial [Pelagibacteraceae bacterium]|nr:transcription elongation factor GreA [Pelagibacteraceae bacterium]